MTGLSYEATLDAIRRVVAAHPYGMTADRFVRECFFDLHGTEARDVEVAAFLVKHDLSATDIVRPGVAFKDPA